MTRSSNLVKKPVIRVPAVAERDQQCLCRTRTQVPFQAQQSGLKDQALPQLWLGSDPGPGNVIGLRAAKKAQQRKQLVINMRGSQGLTTGLPGSAKPPSSSLHLAALQPLALQAIYRVKQWLKQQQTPEGTHGGMGNEGLCVPTANTHTRWGVLLACSPVATLNAALPCIPRQVPRGPSSLQRLPLPGT